MPDSVEFFGKLEAWCLRKIPRSGIRLNGRCEVSYMPNGLWYMFNPETNKCVETGLVLGVDFTFEKTES